MAGRVTNAPGDAVVGARVNLIPAGGNSGRTFRTAGSDGRFSAEHIPAGEYDCVIATVGYMRLRVDRFTINSGATVELGIIVIDTE